MTKQPEALRIADGLEKYPVTYSPYAAAELRRLHETNQEWERVCDQHLRHIKKLKKLIAKATGGQQ